MPKNYLLCGGMGSGKTIVAHVLALYKIRNSHNRVLFVDAERCSNIDIFFDKEYLQNVDVCQYDSISGHEYQIYNHIRNSKIKVIIIDNVAILSPKGIESLKDFISDCNLLGADVILTVPKKRGTQTDFDSHLLIRDMKKIDRYMKVFLLKRSPVIGESYGNINGEIKFYLDDLEKRKTTRICSLLENKLIL